MRRVTVIVPDDLEAKLDAYRARQEAPLSITTVVQVALEAFLQQQELSDRGYRAAQEPFTFDPVDETSERGEPDVSVEHDDYLADAT